ncbi:hypothetical protein FQN57_000252 [Myotisia sp. PD_48]|nr:hypothetical protein FQN57_000252 [Myotisia sp. PD_48]
MSSTNSLNVFKGPDSVINYFNPDLQPPVPLVELPERLNPFRADNVRIYAKILTALPAQNVKALPALNMLLHEPEAATKSIVEASSGSTALSLSIIARILWNNSDVCAYITNKKHPDQLKLLRFFGLQTSLYGGLAQQEPADERGIMCRLKRLAKQDKKFCYLGQYDNSNNWKSHVRWTGPQILQQLPEINVFCTTVGTGGSITGTGVYLKSKKPSVKVVGVCNVFGDPTPGPRHFPGFESSQFPWRETIDTFETIASVDSYEASMRLSREGIIAGPSSGEALCGLIDYLQKAKDSNKLHELADSKTGEISCVFICCDLPYPYLDNYFQKLGEDKFPAIHNKILLSCDLDKYDERWELDSKQAVGILSGRQVAAQRTEPSILCESRSCRRSIAFRRKFPCLGKPSCTSSPTSKVMILDLRQNSDFTNAHIRSSRNSPLKSLTPTSGDIFADSNVLHMFWTNLTAQFNKEANSFCPKSFTLLVLCYDGETSRLATSILRAKGYLAFSVFGGFSALQAYDTDTEK